MATTTPTHATPGEALDAAREALADHAYAPGVSELLARIDELRPDTEDSDAIEKLEKTLAGLGSTRARIVKEERPSEDRNVLAAIDKAERDLGHELMMKKSEGYRRAQEGLAQERAATAARLGGRV